MASKVINSWIVSEPIRRKGRPILKIIHSDRVNYTSGNIYKGIWNKDIPHDNLLLVMSRQVLLTAIMIMAPMQAPTIGISAEPPTD
ncbi:hypothetical protein SAMN05216311_111204 [Chitinophaga sp. CF418]|nr:hypothetical protein SAMN05216311_111204 [Chitinophaga sp. CF418]